jgi:formamidopyrimidine-DNA glycosylase
MLYVADAFAATSIRMLWVPELPEVETIRRCVAPGVIDQTVTEVLVRNPNLRWPVPPALPDCMRGRKISAVERRGKYLLFRCGTGTLIVHLGMSGRILLEPAAKPAEKHDHVDFTLSNGTTLRLNDPRRFGCAVWTEAPPSLHPLLRDLGPEPLTEDFTGRYLHERSRGRSLAVKEFIMNSRIVVGVGNIYANESLFAAKIHPTRPAGRISLQRYRQLAAAVKEVLGAAVEQGGTTLRDFCDAAGNPGYFQLELKVYQRAGQPCCSCGHPIETIRQAQRATFFCRRCQH